MIKNLFLISIFLVGFIMAQEESTDNDKNNNQKNTKHPIFNILLHSPGPGWEEEIPFHEQTGVEEHIKYMRQQLKEGILLIGGPFLDNTGGIMICRTTDNEKAKLIAENDPAVKSGLLNVVVKQWMVPMSSIDLESIKKN